MGKDTDILFYCNDIQYSNRRCEHFNVGQNNEIKDPYLALQNSQLPLLHIHHDPNVGIYLKVGLEMKVKSFSQFKSSETLASTLLTTHLVLCGISVPKIPNIIDVKYDAGELRKKNNRIN